MEDQLLNQIKELLSQHNNDVDKLIRSIVEENVTEKINDLISQNEDRWKREIDEREKIKEDIKPVLDFFRDMKSTKKIIVYILSAITLVGSAWFAAKQIIN